ncbi:hypothetical protein [Corynebacterium hindlerae]|uniref:hypothetical protein n=1 Tax=Corynebacterium hindlerae TaxID=699041 RepID=UPI003AAE2C9C
MSYDFNATATRKSSLTEAALRYPRRFGWGLTTLAAIASYVQLLLPYRWWNVTVVVLGIILVAAFATNCYLAAKSKRADLYFAAVLALASPLLVIIIAMLIFL